MRAAADIAPRRGSSLSNSIAGFIADRAGFNGAFLFLAAAALLAFLLFWLAVPETGERSKPIKGEIDDPMDGNVPTLGLVRLRATAE